MRFRGLGDQPLNHESRVERHTPGPEILRPQNRIAGWHARDRQDQLNFSFFGRVLIRGGRRRSLNIHLCSIEYTYPKLLVVAG